MDLQFFFKRKEYLDDIKRTKDSNYLLKRTIDILLEDSSLFIKEEVKKDEMNMIKFTQDTSSFEERIETFIKERNKYVKKDDKNVKM